jgi:hypothetical protein
MKPGKQNRQPNCEPNRTPSPQGNGSSLTHHRPRDFGEISPIKGGALAASFDGSFVGALAYEIKGEAADDRHVLGSVSGAQAGLILIESHVDGPPSCPITSRYSRARWVTVGVHWVLDQVEVLRSFRGVMVTIFRPARPLLM